MVFMPPATMHACVKTLLTGLPHHCRDVRIILKKQPPRHTTIYTFQGNALRAKPYSKRRKRIVFPPSKPRLIPKNAFSQGENIVIGARKDCIRKAKT